MNYILSLVVLFFLIILFFWIRQKQIHARIPCKRCGEIGGTFSYCSSTSDTTRDYYKVFGKFPYEESFDLCFRCVNAHDSFLRELIILSIEKQQKIGNSTLFEEFEKVWGNRAIDMLALLRVARGDMDSARRILKEDEFNKLKPWIEESLNKSTEIKKV